MLLPNTKKENFSETLHGTKIADPYRWLEGENAEVREWAEQQNQYTRGILDELPYREKIKKRLKELYNVEQVYLPVPRGEYYFFRYRKPNENYWCIYVQKGLDGDCGSGGSACDGDCNG